MSESLVVILNLHILQGSVVTHLRYCENIHDGHKHFTLNPSF